MDLIALTEKARAFLKAMGSKPPGNEKPPVPEAPEDPDRLDPRVEDASPTEASVAQAKGEASAADEGKDDGEDDGEDEGKDESGAPQERPEGEGSHEGEQSPAEEGFDAFGNHDLDARKVQKSLAAEGHVDPTHLPNDFDPEPVVQELIRQMADLQSVVCDLTTQITAFKRGQETTGRDVKKALASGQELREALAKLHETAPAAAAPRAITKSLQAEGGGVTPLITRQELMALASSGQLSPFEVARLNSHLQSPHA